MDINIKVDLGYDETRDQFYLADFDVVKTDTQTGKAPKGKRDRQPSSQPICERSND
jgi:hypothetical protein